MVTKHKELQPELDWCTNEEERLFLEDYLNKLAYLTNTEKKFNEKHVCAICGRKAPHLYDGDYYCSRHIHHLTKYGEILPYTRRTPNEVHFDDLYTYIYLRDNSNDVVGVTIIDKEDTYKALQHKWGRGKKGYAVSAGKTKPLFLHRLVMGLDDEDTRVSDHINRDRLNNTKKNLRITTQKLNTINTSMPRSNTSGFIGVGYTNKGWRATINTEERYLHLGYYSTKIEALKVRLQAEFDLLPEGYAPQRDLFEKYNIIKKSEDIEYKYFTEKPRPIIAESGVKGIRVNNNKSGISYTAYISDASNNQTNLGTYKNKEDATKAVEDKKNYTDIFETLEVDISMHLTGKTYRATNIKTGETKDFVCIKYFCEENNLIPSNVSACLAGRRKTHKGWTFETLED